MPLQKKRQPIEVLLVPRIEHGVPVSILAHGKDNHIPILTRLSTAKTAIDRLHEVIGRFDPSIRVIPDLFVHRHVLIYGEFRDLMIAVLRVPPEQQIHLHAHTFVSIEDAERRVGFDPGTLARLIERPLTIEQQRLLEAPVPNAHELDGETEEISRAPTEEIPRHPRYRIAEKTLGS